MIYYIADNDVSIIYFSVVIVPLTLTLGLGGPRLAMNVHLGCLPSRKESHIMKRILQAMNFIATFLVVSAALVALNDLSANNAPPWIDDPNTLVPDTIAGPISMDVVTAPPWCNTATPARYLVFNDLAPNNQDANMLNNSRVASWRYADPGNIAGNASMAKEKFTYIETDDGIMTVAPPASTSSRATLSGITILNTNVAGANTLKTTTDRAPSRCASTDRAGIAVT